VITYQIKIIESNSYPDKYLLEIREVFTDGGLQIGKTVVCYEADKDSLQLNNIERLPSSDSETIVFIPINEEKTKEKAQRLSETEQELKDVVQGELGKVIKQYLENKIENIVPALTKQVNPISDDILGVEQIKNTKNSNSPQEDAYFTHQIDDETLNQLKTLEHEEILQVLTDVGKQMQLECGNHFGGSTGVVCVVINSFIYTLSLGDSLAFQVEPKANLPEKKKKKSEKKHTKEKNESNHENKSCVQLNPYLHDYKHNSEENIRVNTYIKTVFNYALKIFGDLLSVTGAFGDIGFRQYGLETKPVINSTRVLPGRKLVVGSDGLRLFPEEISDVLSKNKSNQAAANALSKKSKEKTDDDVTVIVDDPTEGHVIGVCDGHTDPEFQKLSFDTGATVSQELAQKFPLVLQHALRKKIEQKKQLQVKSTIKTTTSTLSSTSTSTFSPLPSSSSKASASILTEQEPSTNYKVEHFYENKQHYLKLTEVTTSAVDEKIPAIHIYEYENGKFKLLESKPIVFSSEGAFFGYIKVEDDSDNIAAKLNKIYEINNDQLVVNKEIVVNKESDDITRKRNKTKIKIAQISSEPPPPEFFLNPEITEAVYEEASEFFEDVKKNPAILGLRLGEVLKDVIDKGDLNKITVDDFIDACFKSQMPFIPAEQLNGDGTDWTDNELRHMGVLHNAIIDNVIIYADRIKSDRGLLNNHGEIYKNANKIGNAENDKRNTPPKAAFVFTSGGLYAGPGCDIEKITSVKNGKRVFDLQKYEQDFENRYLHLLMAANENAISDGNTNFIFTFPMMSGDYFGGNYAEDIRRNFQPTLEKFIQKHGDKFSNLKGVTFDKYKGGNKFKVDRRDIALTNGNKIRFVVTASHISHNGFPSAMSRPEEQMGSGEFKNCKLFVSIAGDPAGYKTNDSMVLSTISQEAICTQTNLPGTVTGVDGDYDESKGLFLPYDAQKDASKRKPIHKEFRELCHELQRFVGVDTFHIRKPGGTLVKRKYQKSAAYKPRKLDLLKPANYLAKDRKIKLGMITKAKAELQKKKLIGKIFNKANVQVTNTSADYQELKRFIDNHPDAASDFEAMLEKVDDDAFTSVLTIMKNMTGDDNKAIFLSNIKFLLTKNVIINQKFIDVYHKDTVLFYLLLDQRNHHENPYFISSINALLTTDNITASYFIEGSAWLRVNIELCRFMSEIDQSHLTESNIKLFGQKENLQWIALLFKVCEQYKQLSIKSIYEDLRPLDTLHKIEYINKLKNPNVIQAVSLLHAAEIPLNNALLDKITPECASAIIALEKYHLLTTEGFEAVFNQDDHIRDGIIKLINFLSKFNLSERNFTVVLTNALYFKKRKNIIIVQVDKIIADRMHDDYDNHRPLNQQTFQGHPQDQAKLLTDFSTFIVANQLNINLMPITVTHNKNNPDFIMLDRDLDRIANISNAHTSQPDNGSLTLISPSNFSDKFRQGGRFSYVEERLERIKNKDYQNGNKLALMNDCLASIENTVLHAQIKYPARFSSRYSPKTFHDGLEAISNTVHRITTKPFLDKFNALQSVKAEFHFRNHGKSGLTAATSKFGLFGMLNSRSPEIDLIYRAVDNMDDLFKKTDYKIRSFKELINIQIKLDFVDFIDSEIKRLEKSRSILDEAPDIKIDVYKALRKLIVDNVSSDDFDQALKNIFNIINDYTLVKDPNNGQVFLCSQDDAKLKHKDKLAISNDKYKKDPENNKPYLTFMEILAVNRSSDINDEDASSRVSSIKNINNKIFEFRQLREKCMELARPFVPPNVAPIVNNFN